MTKSLTFSLWLSLAALVFPVKTLLFTVFKSLTKRDYSYQIDDFCDLAITGLILFWLYMYMAYSNTDDPEVTEFTEIPA